MFVGTWWSLMPVSYTHLSQPEMLLSAKVLQIQEYDDVLTARIIEKITAVSYTHLSVRAKSVLSAMPVLPKEHRWCSQAEKEMCIRDRYYA